MAANIQQAITWANAQRIPMRHWAPLDAPNRVRGHGPGGARVVVLEGAGRRFDYERLLQAARQAGLVVVFEQGA